MDTATSLAADDEISGSTSGAPDFMSMSEDMSKAEPEVKQTPTAEPKPVEPKSEPKVKLEPKLVPGGKSTTAPVAPAKRDLSGINQSVHTFLEQMSGPAFEHFAAIQRKIDAGQLVPAEDVEARLASARVQDHPRGFVLTPEFEKTTVALADTGRVVSSLENALIACKSKESFSFLIRDAKGNLVPSEKYSATPSNEVKLARMLDQASAHANKLETDLNSLEADHTKAHGARTKDITEYDTKMFGALDKNVNFKPHVDGALSEMPLSLAKHPFGQLLAKAQAFSLMLANELEALKAGKKRNDGFAGASPSGDTGQGAGGSDGAELEGALKRNAELFGMA